MPQASAGDVTQVQDALAEAMALHQRGMLLPAARIYEDILRQQPDHFDALHLLGQVALKTQRAARGVELIKMAIALNPGAAAAHSNTSPLECAPSRVSRVHGPRGSERAGSNPLPLE